MRNVSTTRTEPTTGQRHPLDRTTRRTAPHGPTRHLPAAEPRTHRGQQILTTRVGLRFPAALAFETWEQAGAKLFETADSFAWCLGDWLVYGQDKYGDRYRRAIDTAGLDYQTLRNYAWVARKFTMERRHPELSFQHHAEVAPLDHAGQDLWLARAHENRWSKSELRRRLRAARNPVPVSAPAKLPDLTLPAQAMDRWQAAAGRAGVPLDDWIITTLEQAAAAAAQPVPGP